MRGDLYVYWLHDNDGDDNGIIITVLFIGLVLQFTPLFIRYRAVAHPLTYKTEATIQRAFMKVAVGWVVGSISPSIATYYAVQTHISQLRKSLSAPTFMPTAVTIVTAQVSVIDGILHICTRQKDFHPLFKRQ